MTRLPSVRQIKLMLRFMYWVIHSLNSRGASEGSLRLEQDLEKEIQDFGGRP